MGCCVSHFPENNTEFGVPSHINPIDMNFVQNHSPRNECAYSPLSDRGDSSVKINRKKFVASFTGELSEYYRIEEKLGSGSYGTVYRAVHLASGCVRAIKSIPKSKLEASKRSQLYMEAEILKQMDHPYIIKIFEVIESPTEVNIVTDLCTGGNLFARVSSLPVFTENMSAKYMLQIVSALLYCHKNNIVHRDLKPENILFETSDEASTLKLIDFGISTKLEENQSLSKFIGTVYYVAPEVIEGNYNEKCDIWSCGVILYALLSGKAPFNGSSKEEILASIRKGLFTFQDPTWRKVSQSVKSLIKSMLSKDPARRPSAEDVYYHPWIQQRAYSRIEDNKLSQKVLRSLADFHGTWKIREATLNYIVCQMVSVNEVKNLRNIFMSLDENGDGKLSIEELMNGFERLNLGDKYNIHTILDSCDSDKNGFIEYSEFLTATINWHKALSLERLLIAFKAYDTDNNGKISLSEIKEFIGDDSIDDEIWEEMFEEADLNKDGFIDIDEFKLIMTQRTTF